MSTGEAWFEDAPTTRERVRDDDAELDGGAMVLRAPDNGLVARRNEYTELAELATAQGPRDPRALLAEARRVGELLGDRAFYDWGQGKGRVTGPSIDLMDALAIVWGRVVSRVEIVAETDRRVHLRGRVIDLLALTAVERDYMSGISPAPGRFANDRDQADRWRVMQLQAASSKAIRGALEHALPAWLVDAAMDSARRAKAAAATGGKPLPEARALALEHLEKLGVDRALAEAFTSQPIDLWAADELYILRALARDLRDGRTSIEAVRASVATEQPEAATDRMAGLGLGKQASPPPSPTPAAAAGASAPGGSGSGTPGSGGGQAATTAPKAPTKAQLAEAADDAAKLRDLLYKTRSPGSLITGDNPRASLRTAANIGRCSDDRLVRCLEAGQAAGYWNLKGGGVLLPDPLPGQEPAPAEAPTPDRWAALEGDALASELSELSIRVGDSACERAFAAVGMAEAEVETASDDRIRELGRALDREESAFRRSEE